MAEESKRDKLKNLVETLSAAADRKKFFKLAYFKPYPKQSKFMALGATKRERLLTAGNQQGKTEAGAAEAAYHATGLYPKWWKGRVWERPTKGWVVGETGVLVRDVQQKKLVGPPGVVADFGSGLIPRDMIIDKTLARGVSDAYDTIQVRHTSGGVSIVTFKSYEQGRTKLQGDSLDWVWADEEMSGPDAEAIYSELLARTTAGSDPNNPQVGILFLTLTPLQGMTRVVSRFLQEEHQDRAFINMVIEDAAHISEADRQKIIEGYKPHERAARTRGEPMLGEGAVFPFDEATLKTELSMGMVPAHWAKIWGIDFGIAHPFAGVLCAWDRETDIFYVLHTLRVSDQMPLQHAVPMKAVGVNVPVAWPQDGHQRDKGSGDVLSLIYKRQGLRMLTDHATWPDGSISTEAGILELQERMQTGRFKCNAWCTEFWEEYRRLHRKDGLIVKVFDDVIDATLKALMMRRFARPVVLGSRPFRRSGHGNPQVADGVDFDVFSVA